MLNRLQYFYAVVRQKSFTAAAQEKFISQSAISQHIQALEREIGVELIQRSGRQISLTPAGEYFYAHSQKIAEDFERLCVETKKIAERGKKDLYIGYMKACDDIEIHHTMAVFCQRHAEVDIHAADCTLPRLAELLRFGGLDIIICEKRTNPGAEYIAYPVATVNCYAEVSINNPLANKEAVELTDLRFLPGILVTTDEQKDREIQFYQNNLGFLNSFTVAGSLREARIDAISGRGFIPVDGFGGAESMSLAIRRIPIYKDGVPIKRNYFAFWKASNDKPYIKEFVDILRAQFPQNQL